MSRPLSLTELRGLNLRAKNSHQRRESSLSHFGGSAEKDPRLSGTSDLYGSSFADLIDLTSDDIADGPILTLDPPPIQKYPSNEEQPHTPNLMRYEGNFGGSDTFRLHPETLQTLASDADKEAFLSRQEGHGSDLKRCLSSELQQSGAAPKKPKSGGASRSRSSSSCSSCSRSGGSGGSSSSSSGSSSSGSRSSGSSSSSSSSSRSSSSKNKDRNGDRSSSGNRDMSGSTHRVRSGSRHRVRSGSRHRVRSSSRGRSNSRRRSSSRHRWRSSSRHRGRSSSRHRGRSSSRKRIRSRSQNRSKTPTKSLKPNNNLELARKEEQEIQSSGPTAAVSLHQIKSLPKTSTLKNQAENNVLTTRTPSQPEGFSKNLDQNLNSPFSAEVKRFLDIFNKSGLPEAGDKASKERCVVPGQPNNSFSRKEKLEERETTGKHSNVLLSSESASQHGHEFSRLAGLMADCRSVKENIPGRVPDTTVHKPAPLPQASVQRDRVRPAVEATIKQRDSAKKLAEPPQEETPPQQEYEKIHDILKTIGVNIGVTEIGKLSVRAQQRHRGKKQTARSPERTHSPESSPCPSQPTASSREASKDRFIQPMPDYSKDKDVGQRIPAPVLGRDVTAPVLGLQVPAIPSLVLGQQVPSVLRNEMNDPVLGKPQAPVQNALPDINVPTPASQYHVSNYATPRMPLNYVPLPSQTLPSYGQYMPAPGWPVCPTSPTIPTNHPHANLGVVPTIGMNKELYIEGSALVHPHTMITMQASQRTREPLSDEKNQECERQKVIEERERLKFDREVRQKKIVYLQAKLEHLRKQIGWSPCRKVPEMAGLKDPVLEEMSRVHDYLLSELTGLIHEDRMAAEKQSELDAVADILGIYTGKSRKQSTESKGVLVERGRKREKSRSQEKPSKREKSRSQEKNSGEEKSRNQEKHSKREEPKTKEKHSKQGKARRHKNHSKREGSISQENTSPPMKDSCPNTKKSHYKTSKSTKPPSNSAVQLADLYEYFDAGNHWCRDCNTFCGNMIDFFTHMHHKKHQQTLDPYMRPWVLESQGEMKQEPTTRSNKIAVPAKGLEFLIPVTGFYCTLCKEFLGDEIIAEQHVKSYNHNENYKKYVERNLLYEERRNLDRQAGLAVAMGAKRRRERELKLKLEEALQEDNKDTQSVVTKDLCTVKEDQRTSKAESAQKNQSTEQQHDTKPGPKKNEEQRNASKKEPLISNVEKSAASCVAGEDTDGNIYLDSNNKKPVRVIKPKPISITIAKKPVLSQLNQQKPVSFGQAKIRPNLPVPSIVQRKFVTTTISKPAPLDTFLSIKSGPTTKPLPLVKDGTESDIVLAPDTSKAIEDSQVLWKESESSLMAPELSKLATQPQKPLLPVACGHSEGIMSKAPEIQKPLIKLQAPPESVAFGGEKMIGNETGNDEPKEPHPSPQLPIAHLSSIALEGAPGVMLNEQTVCAVPVQPPPHPSQIVSLKPIVVDAPQFSCTATNAEHLYDIFYSCGVKTSNINSLSSSTNGNGQKVESENKISDLNQSLGSLSPTKSAPSLLVSTPLESSHVHPVAKTEPANEIKVIPESKDPKVMNVNVSMFTVEIKQTSESSTQADVSVKSQDAQVSGIQVMQNHKKALLSGGFRTGSSGSCTHVVEVKKLELAGTESDVSQRSPGSHLGIVNEDRDMQVINSTLILSANGESVEVGNADKAGDHPDVSLKTIISQAAEVQDKTQDNNVHKNEMKPVVSDNSVLSEREGELTVSQSESSDTSGLDRDKEQVLLEGIECPPESTISQTDCEVKQSPKTVEIESPRMSEVQNTDAVMTLVNPETSVTSLVDTKQEELGKPDSPDTSDSERPAHVLEAQQTQEINGEVTLLSQVSTVVPELDIIKSSESSSNFTVNVKQEEMTLDAHLQSKPDPTHSSVLEIVDQVLVVQQQRTSEVNVEIPGALAAQDMGTVVAVEITEVFTSSKVDRTTDYQSESRKDLPGGSLTVGNQETCKGKTPDLLDRTDASKSDVDVKKVGLGVQEGICEELPSSQSIEVEDTLTKDAVSNLTGMLPENMFQSSSNQALMLSLDEDPERKEVAASNFMTRKRSVDLEDIDFSSAQMENIQESLDTTTTDLKIENIVGGPLTSADDLNPPKASTFDLATTYSEFSFEHADSLDLNFNNEDGPSGVVKADLKCSDPDSLKAELGLEHMDLGLEDIEEAHEHLSIFPAETLPDHMEDTPDSGSTETIHLVAAASSVLGLGQTLSESKMDFSTLTSVDGAEESFCKLVSKSNTSRSGASDLGMSVLEPQGLSPLSESPMQIEENGDEDCDVLVSREQIAAHQFSQSGKAGILNPALPEGVTTSAEEVLCGSSYWAAKSEPKTPTTELVSGNEKIQVTVNVLESSSARFSVVPNPIEDPESPDASEEAAYLSD